MGRAESEMVGSSSHIVKVIVYVKLRYFHFCNKQDHQVR